MKTCNFYKLITLFIVITFVFSCVQDDDFQIPNTGGETPNLDGQVLTIGSIISALNQQIFLAADNLGFEPGDFGFESIISELRESEELLFDGDNISYLEGFVVSSDESGNFFEEFIMQNASSNPTSGIRVLIDVSPLFTYIEFGRKVFINLNSLTVKYSNGVISLGIANGNNLEKIPESNLIDFIIRDNEVATIVPKVITFSDFNDSNVNLYIRLNNVQFESNQVSIDNPLTYASEVEDQFDGERILESCENDQSVVFSTSTFADFKSLTLPSGTGILDGLLTKNFFGDDFNITINDPTTVQLNNAERCDPTQVDCGLSITTGSTVLFSDFFEGQSVNSPISQNGWTNFIEEGTQSWGAYFDDGTNASLGISANISSFNSGDDSSIAWLVTPAINFDIQDGETFNFQSSNSFSDGSVLLVLISLDWDGIAENIPGANWSELPSVFIVGDTDFFGDWFPSGNVGLDCVEGLGHIAFKYIGNGNPDFDGTYEIDEIEIHSN